MSGVSGTMEVNVVSAKDLKNAELFGRMCPYVVLEYKSQEHKSTTGLRSGPHNQNKMTSRLRMRCCICLHGQGGSPVWNEKFKFRVEYENHDDDNNNNNNNNNKNVELHKLILKIMDHDNFTSDDYLGQATIYLKELFERGAEEGTAELRPQKYRVVSEDKTYHGEIEVGVTFTTAKREKSTSKQMVET